MFGNNAIVVETCLYLKLRLVSICSCFFAQHVVIVRIGWFGINDLLVIWNVVLEDKNFAQEFVVICRSLSLLVASCCKHSASVLLSPCPALTTFLSPFLLLFFPFVLKSMDQSCFNYFKLIILTSN